MKLVQLTILGCLILFQSFIHSQTTYTLTISNSEWSNPNIWTPNGIPGPGDFVIIGNTVEISGSYEIAGFNLANGTIKFTGEANPSLTVTDSSIWSSGTFNGGNGANGGTIVNNALIFADGSVVTLVEDALHPFHHLYEGTYLTNLGTIKLQGSANLGVRGLSILKNEGVFDVMSDADFNGESFSGGYFINTSTGVFRKSGGTDITSFNLWWNFKNDGGTIDVNSGDLQFQCDGTFENGYYNASTGAILSFRSHTQNFKGTLSGSPSGNVGIYNSTINIDSTGATLDFQGNGFQWPDGDITGGGVLTIQNGSLLVMNGNNNSGPFLRGTTTLLNLGTVKLEGASNFYIQGNSLVDNRALFEVISDADFDGSTFSGGTFLNSGILRKSGGTDITSFNTWWNFQNQGGTIDAQSGSIHFSGLGTFDGGNFIASDNATIDFRSSTQIFKGTLNGSPVGAVRLSGSTINIDSSGATLDFQGTGFQFSNGVLTGGGTLNIPLGSLLRLVADPVDPTPSQSLRGGTTLLNLGTVKQESNTTFGINGNSIVDNRSLFEIFTDADFSGGTGSGGTFYNTGTFRKSGGTDVTQMNNWWKFFNQNGGIIDASSGELEFTMTNTNFSNDPGAIIKGTDSIDVPTSFTNNGIISPGSSLGVLTYVGNFVPSSNGVLDIELGGLTVGTEYDQLNVTGNATLNGSLKVRIANGFVPNNGDSFVILNTSGIVSSDFSALDIQDGLYLTVIKNSNNVTLVVDSVGILDVKELNDGDVVSDYSLSQNYPNPFNPNTNIQFALPQSGHVTLEIFSVTGERVDVLISEVLNAGKYNYEWNASKLTSGIYFYKLNAGSFVETKKLILLK
jgi:hypothetical protein